MIRIKGVILCEGDSDRILLGSYLCQVNEWRYKKKFDDAPFSGNISWYENSRNENLGIWTINGNNFIPAIQQIMELEVNEHIVEAIVVITDHDDEEAEETRPKEIYKAIDNIVHITNINVNVNDLYKNNNEWVNIQYTSSFSQTVNLRFCYLLVPIDSQGALETFMLKALSEDSQTKQEVIEQVRKFIHGLKVQEFLKKRREKIKAELSVSISIFAPDRMFDTLFELIKIVDWTKFDITHKQFGILRTI